MEASRPTHQGGVNMLTSTGQAPVRSNLDPTPNVLRKLLPREGNPGKIGLQPLQTIPHRGGNPRKFWEAGDIRNHTAAYRGGGAHYLPIPTPIPTKASTPTTPKYGRKGDSGPPYLPPNTRDYDWEVDPTEWRKASNGTAPGNGPHIFRPLRCCHPSIHSDPAGSVCGGSRSRVAPPFSDGANREGFNILHPPSSISTLYVGCWDMGTCLPSGRR